MAIINDHYFVSVSENGTLIIWCYNSFQKILNWKENLTPINSLVIDDEKYIYLGKHDGTIIKLKVDLEKKRIQKIEERKCHNGIIRKLKIDKGILYSASEDSTVKTWSKHDLNLLKEFKHKNFVQDIAIYESYFISVSYDGQILKHEKPIYKI